MKDKRFPNSMSVDHSQRPSGVLELPDQRKPTLVDSIVSTAHTHAGRTPDELEAKFLKVLSAPRPKPQSFPSIERYRDYLNELCKLQDRSFNILGVDAFAIKDKDKQK